MAMRDDSSRLVSVVLVLAVNAAALWVSAALLGGFDIGGIGSLIGVAFIFAVVNSVLKPVANFISYPLTIFTLGLIALVVNGLLLMLTAWVGDLVGLDVSLDNFLDAVLAALIISIVSWLLNTFVGKPVGIHPQRL